MPLTPSTVLTKRSLVLVNLKLAPAAVVRPAILFTVLAFSDNHDGRLPADTAKVYVPEPPVALTVVLRAVKAPTGRDETVEDDYYSDSVSEEVLEAELASAGAAGVNPAAQPAGSAATREDT